jgi:hypothetical protein
MIMTYKEYIQAELERLEEDLRYQDGRRDMLKQIQRNVQEGYITEPSVTSDRLNDQIIVAAVTLVSTETEFRPNLIQAIQKHRALTNSGLKESKEYCEQLFGQVFGQNWRQLIYGKGA